MMLSFSSLFSQVMNAGIVIGNPVTDEQRLKLGRRRELNGAISKQ
jgi:hypothetical protein